MTSEAGLRALAMGEMCLFGASKDPIAISWREDWAGTLTVYQGRARIDASRTWNYPESVMTDEDRIEVLDLLTRIGSARARIEELLARYSR